jgi:hypothetical protein
MTKVLVVIVVIAIAVCALIDFLDQSHPPVWNDQEAQDFENELLKKKAEDTHG